MNINKVYLDMDGVLVDFLDGLHREFGVPYHVNSHQYQVNKWDILTDIKKSDGTCATFADCNHACTEEFWANLEWMPDGHDILRLVTSTFEPEQIYLLTTPMPNMGSYTGKALWVQKHLPAYSKRLIVTPVSKSLFARPDTLLIDDKNENIDAFVAAGGRRLLVPRPWNRAHFCADRTYTTVKHFLENLNVN